MAHLTFHERRILRDLERQLAGDPEFTRLLAALDRQEHPPTTARRPRFLAAVAKGCLVGLALAAAYLWAGWGLLAFTALVLFVCAPPLWVNQRRRRAPTTGKGGSGYWRAKRPTPRMWIRWRAHQHLTRPQR